jgi:hypothetical protein
MIALNILLVIINLVLLVLIGYFVGYYKKEVMSLLDKINHSNKNIEDFNKEDFNKSIIEIKDNLDRLEEKVRYKQKF